MLNFSAYVGEGGHVRYDDVPSGAYTFRIVAISESGERAVFRRTVHVGIIIIRLK